MARARQKLSARELIELYDHVKFTRADGRCECEGDCGRSHRFGIHYRCPNAHGRPGVHGSDKMISLKCVYLDGDKSNTLDTNLMAMCQTCATRRGAQRRGESKTVEKRRRIEAQHDPLFELAPAVSDQSAGVNEL